MSEYEPQYNAAVAAVQALFADAPTPGEVVRAIERLGWAPRGYVREKTLDSVTLFEFAWPSDEAEEAFLEGMTSLRVSDDSHPGGAS